MESRDSQLPLPAKRPKPVVLVVLDGFGVNQHYSGNAITLAKKPFFDRLVSEYPSMTLRASGEAVGLPWGESGNSEVGHLNLGLGRIVYQDLPRINKAIQDNSFYTNPKLMKAVEHTRQNKSKLHLMGLVSNGGVHSSIDHLHALLVFCREHGIKDVLLHVILDGRDTSYNAGANFVKSVERTMREYGVGRIATVSGRFYAMDRNNNWDRTGKAYAAMTVGAGNEAESPEGAVRASYNKKIYDEEFVPTVVTSEGKPAGLVEENDSIIFFNFRPDRARQITKAFMIADLDKFDRPVFFNNLCFVCFTEYEKGLPVEVAFPVEDLDNGLGEVISRGGYRQLRIAETEKYAHVTYFFNGGREEKNPGEDHALIPSPAVTTYDQKPEMAAREITARLTSEIESDKYDFVFVNYANADMVGHTGVIDAAKQAVEVLDEVLEKLVKAVLLRDGVLLITADHGNAEVMFNMQTGQIDKEHTANPVPFILVGNEFHGKNFGWQNVVGSDLSLVQPQGILSDVAPTVIKLMGLEKPREITGMSLV